MGANVNPPVQALSLSSPAGIVHVGANIGQEPDRYAELSLNVLWIEPVQDVFARLSENIRQYPNQRALLALVSETDGERVSFNISSNDGLSSSDLPLAAHRDIWPDVDYVRTLDLEGRSFGVVGWSQHR